MSIVIKAENRITEDLGQGADMPAHEWNVSPLRSPFYFPVSQCYDDYSVAEDTLFFRARSGFLLNFFCLVRHC